MSAADDDGRFEAALRGEDSDSPLARRLGEALRSQHQIALKQVDQLAQQRVWNSLARQLDSFAPRNSPMWGFARAASFVFLGLAVGWFGGRIGWPGAGETQLEFAYGDLERSRGDTLERTVIVQRPLDAMHTLTDAFIHDSLAFEIYSLPVPGERRIVFTWPSAVPAQSDRALKALAISPQSGTMYAITFTSRRGGG